LTLPGDYLKIGKVLQSKSSVWEYKKGGCPMFDFLHNRRIPEGFHLPKWMLKEYFGIEEEQLQVETNLILEKLTQQIDDLSHDDHSPITIWLAFQVMADQLSETLSDSVEIYHKLAQGELTAREALALTRLRQIERDYYDEDEDEDKE